MVVNVSAVTLGGIATVYRQFGGIAHQKATTTNKLQGFTIALAGYGLKWMVLLDMTYAATAPAGFAGF